MKSLLLLRHAKSSWENAHLADFDRPLSERGERDAPRMGRLLRREDLVPDLIVTSTARRAQQTAERVATYSGYEHDIEYTRDFYHAGPGEYLAHLAQLSDTWQQVMVVGHNPGLEELLELLTGEAELLPTAAIAHVRLPIHRWHELNEKTEGELVAVWRPREVS